MVPSRKRVLLTLALLAPVGCSLAVGFGGLEGNPSTDAGEASTTTGSDGSTSGDGFAPGSDANVTGSDSPSGNAYVTAVMADGPLAYFHLDETSGTTVHDSSGNGHDGDAHNLKLGAAGAFAASGTAAHFDGKGYVSIPDSVSGMGTPFDFTQSTPFTLEAWVMIDQQPVKDMTAYTFFSKELRLPDAGGYDGIDFFTEPNIKLQRENDPIATTQVLVMHGLPATATWYYLVGTYDGKQLTVSIDLVPQGTVQSPNALQVVNVPFLLGAEDTSLTEALVGSMDEVAIYRKALSPAQLATHFHAAGR